MTTVPPAIDGHRPVIQDQEQELRRALAEFTLLLVRTMMQASYYAPDHPAHQRGTAQAYDLLRPLLGHSSEIVFMTGSLNDTSDVQVDGVLAEPVGVTSLLQSAMGEHFVAKFLEYFERNELVSFSIKHHIEKEEFNRFMGAVVERRLDIGENQPRERRLPFDEILQQVGVVHIGVMCRDEIVGGKRRIPWAVRVALSRLRKDLQMVPLYCRASQRELHEVKSMLVQDVIRPLRRVDLMRELLLNADLISLEIAEGASIDVDAEIVRNMHTDMAATVASRLAEELISLRGGTPPQHHSFGSVELLEQRLVSSVYQIVGHFFRTGARYDLGLVRSLFDQKVLDMKELPTEARRAVQVERWTDQFLHDPRAHLERLAAITSEGPYAELLTVMRLIFGELVLRRKWRDALLIVQALDRQHRERCPPFPERTALLRAALDRMCAEDQLRPLVLVFTSTTREDRGTVLRIFTTLGVEAVPFMLEALLLSDDAATRRDLCTAIEQMGKPAGRYLLMEAESFNHKWHFYRNVVMLLGRLRYEEAAPAVARQLGHFHPRVREEAVGALARIQRRNAEPLLVPLLRDPDPAVVRRVVSALRTLRSRDPELLEFLRETVVASGAVGADHGVAAAAIRALRDMGNIALSEGETAETLLLGLLEPGRRRLFRRTARAPEELRAAAVETLGAIGTTLALAALKRLAITDPGMESQVTSALDALGRRLGARSGQPT